MSYEPQVYTFEDEDGTPDEWDTMDYSEAKEYASQHKLAVIANTYVWEDSELVDDFRDSKPDDDEDEETVEDGD